jgi:adenosine deaminase
MEQKMSAIQKNSNKAEKGKNWRVFDFCNQFLQSEEQLTKTTLDLCQRLAGKNVVYAEIRFCPELHTEQGLTAEQALIAVIKGNL